MGAALEILFAPGEVKKLPSFLQHDQSIDIPDIQNFSESCNIWIERSNRQLRLCYSFGDGQVGSIFSILLAKSIVVRFQAEKVGWDSVGYCESLDEFINCDPWYGFFRLQRKKTRMSVMTQLHKFLAQLPWDE